MAGTIVKSLLMLCCILIWAAGCSGSTQPTRLMLAGKTYEQLGYAEDQMPPNEVKANPEFAKMFVTSRACVHFVNDSTVELSYWVYNQSLKSSRGPFVTEGNRIIYKGVFDAGFIGTVYKMADSTRLVSINGQFQEKEFKLTNEE